ncbi:expressed protein [Phakopsora pachyrhizi]|uniref:Expressed protein n=1 Tax=Phakopsora pachyrhizi TaxID=170000 RepID=A0AAV0BJS4_PHAPC|nr:expressed protein [Phakopsora pachyrhizi]
MIIHSFITIVSLFAYNFFTLFSSETSGIIFYASASHVPPDSIKFLVESSQPEGSSSKSIEKLGNEAYNDYEMVPGVDSAKLPRYNYKTTEDLMSESEDELPYYRSRAQNKFKRPKNLRSESDFADWDRKVEHMKRRHLLLGRPISESALDEFSRCWGRIFFSGSSKKKSAPFLKYEGLTLRRMKTMISPRCSKRWVD